MSNTLDEAREVSESMGELFPGVLQIEIDEYENVIVVGGPSALSASELRGIVSRDPVLASSVQKMSFRTRTKADRGTRRRRE